MPRLDATDWAILDVLQDDARTSNRDLAAAVHVSPSTSSERVRGLRADGVIRGYHADIDPVLAGLGTTAYVTVTLQQAEWRAVRDQLQTLQGVEHIGLVGGDFDVILLVRARDNADLRRIVLDRIQGMEGVLNTRTLLVFEEPEVRPSGAGAP
jgi:DNA-binding Lrp family transcriptional regulator